MGQVVVGCPCPGIAPGLECSGECVARRFDWLGRRSVSVCVCVSEGYGICTESR